MKAKNQRLTLLVLAIAAVLGAVLLAMSALKDQAAYFYTPGDVARAGPPLGRAVRIAGPDVMSRPADLRSFMPGPA